MTDALLGTAVGEEVFVTDAELTGFAEPPVDEAYSTNDVADCCELDNLCCGPVWTVTAGALIMDRSTPDDAVLVTDSLQAGGNVLLDAGEFDFDFRGGWELGAIRHNFRCTCWDLEARYARIDGWRSVRDFVFSPYGSVVHYRTPIGNTAFSALVGAAYESHFDSLELNLRRPIGCGGLTLLAGFRFAELDERGMTILRVTDPGALENLATSQIGAINDLYGFQLGADGCLWQWCCLSLDGKLRAGVYSNRAVNSVTHVQTGAPEAWGSRARDNQAAFLGELGLTGTCQLTDGVALRAGYQLTWLEGVAVASDQVAVSDPVFGTATVDTDGGVLYHGAVISLEFSR
ncbi:MAG TPA: hypothetical protein VMY37_00530 [Thermoguttaceae bacterium]|nr:hypothetical protein [Thermoguttaceae bacterium]